MQQGPPTYTAAQIGSALRLSKRSVLRALADTPAQTVIVRGNAAQAWTVDGLPETLRARLASLASSQKLSLADYLDAHAKPWQPSIPLGDIHEACIADAQKLQTALLPSLQRLDSPVLDSADRARLGLADYERAFGHGITERHWRRLLDRTLLRDGGAEDFNRLELFLPDRLTRKDAAAAVLPSEQRFALLCGSMKGFGNSAAPNRSEIAAFWCEAFELYESELDGAASERALRRDLIAFLSRHARWLAESRNALRVAFERKYSRWMEKGRTAAALLDGREEKRGVPVEPEIPQADRDLITWKAIAECGGRTAQAVRELAVRGQRSGLTDETLGLVCGRGSRKSYVPRRVLESVKHEVKQLAPYLLGKKAVDDATAHIERDYSKLVSMQIVNADDFTMPVYFYVPDGLGWYTLTRGQCLIMLDVRSWKIIAWSLQPERNYNSLTIRTLMNRVCSAWGIPSVWYFEQGIWKNSLIVKGEAPSLWNDALSWSESKLGWENLGVRFLHAIRARSKPVERVGGLLQDLMHGVRGYCGRDERHDLPLATKRAMDDVKFKRVKHPGELFLSFDEWNAQLGEIIDRYNSTSQDGEVLQGLSPEESFEQHWPHNNPPSRMDANSWHLVAHYSRPVPVTANGITFKIGSRKFTYRNERTGQDRGKTVLAWFDPECPEFLCVTDMNRKNPYLVPRSSKVDFLADADDPALQRELGLAAAHSSYPRARFHTLRAKFAPTFRRNFVDAETSEMAQEIAQQRQTITTARKQASAQIARARKAYGKIGMNLPRRVRPGQTEAAERLAQMLNQTE